MHGEMQFKMGEMRAAATHLSEGASALKLGANVDEAEDRARCAEAPSMGLARVW